MAASTPEPVTELPQITFRTRGNSLPLAWPVSVGPFQLKRRDSLLPDPWNSFTGSMVVVNNQFEATIQPDLPGPGFIGLRSSGLSIANASVPASS